MGVRGSAFASRALRYVAANHSSFILFYHGPHCHSRLHRIHGRRVINRSPASGREITTLTSRYGSPQASVHPSLAGRLDLVVTEDLGSIAASRADCVFSCLPHGLTATVALQLLAAGSRVTDFAGGLSARRRGHTGTAVRRASRPRQSRWQKWCMVCRNCFASRLSRRNWSPIPAVIPRRRFCRSRRY